jgi:predicted GTPase
VQTSVVEALTGLEFRKKEDHGSTHQVRVHGMEGMTLMDFPGLGEGMRSAAADRDLFNERVRGFVVMHDLGTKLDEHERSFVLQAMQSRKPFMLCFTRSDEVVLHSRFVGSEGWDENMRKDRTWELVGQWPDALEATAFKRLCLKSPMICVKHFERVRDKLGSADVVKNGVPLLKE